MPNVWKVATDQGRASWRSEIQVDAEGPIYYCAFEELTKLLMKKILLIITAVLLLATGLALQSADGDVKSSTKADSKKLMSMTILLRDGQDLTVHFNSGSLANLPSEWQASGSPHKKVVTYEYDHEGPVPAKGKVTVDLTQIIAIQAKTHQ